MIGQEIAARLISVLQARRDFVIGWSFVVVLLGMGIPQTIDSFFVVYARSIANITEPGPVPPLPVAAAAARLLRSADQWTGDADARIEAGIIERRAAAGDAGQVNNSTALAVAAQDLSAGLGRAPANSLGWAELAAADLGLAKIPRALAAWRNSILMGNYDPSLNFWRAQIGTELWLALDPNDRRLLAAQLSFSWDQDRAKLISFAELSNVAAEAVRLALGNDPERLAEFNSSLQRGF